MRSGHLQSLGTGVLLALLSMVAFAQTQPTTDQSATRPAQADRKAGSYFLRLIDDHGIWRNEQGEVDLVQISPSGRGRSYLVRGVRSYAVVGKTIIGETDKGYFAVDIPAFGVQDPMSRSDWLDALSQRGIPAATPLLDPDAQATTRPTAELHPWDYALLRNLLGFSDNAWGMMFVLMAFVASGGMGYYVGRRLECGLISLALGGAAGFYLMLLPGDVMCCSTVFVYGPLSYAFYRAGAGSGKRRRWKRALRSPTVAAEIAALRDYVEGVATWDDAAVAHVTQVAHRLLNTGLTRPQVAELLEAAGMEAKDAWNIAHIDPPPGV